MIDQHTSWLNGTGRNRIHDQTRPFQFVLEMRCVHEDQLVVFFGQSDLFFENDELILRVLVQPDFTDPENIVLLEELRNQRHDLASKAWIIGFFRVNAEPAEVLNPKLGGSARFVLGELPKIVVETLSTGAIKTCPECGFGHSNAPGLRHPHVVVRGSGDHMNVWVDVLQDDAPDSDSVGPGVAPAAPFIPSAD